MMDALLLDKLSSAYRAQQAAIELRLAEFAAVPPDLYFYELTYCLLTPQSSAVHAGMVQQKLMAMNFQKSTVDPEPILRDPEHYIRFHKTKSRHLLIMKGQYETIAASLHGMETPDIKREWLVKNVLGLSYKESTHFLRNIGKNGSMAILDRHILKHLLRHHVITELSRTLTNRKYLEIEKAFQEFADTIGIPINALDLLFWSSETGVMLK